MWNMGSGTFSFLARVRYKPLAQVLLSAALLIVGWDPKTCAAQDASTSHSVQGVVLNSLTHQPIARALVDAAADDVLTDSNGRFVLNLPMASSLFITCSRPGYAIGPGSMVQVHGGEGAVNLTLFLTPQSVIAGHIATSAGEDAEGTHVTVYRRRTRREQSWWETQGQTSTDSTGRFRLTSLQAPAEYLLVTAPLIDREGHATTSTYGYPPVFYPDGAETSANGLISLSPGQQANVELSLVRQPFYPVTIRVRNDTGPAPIFIQVHDDTDLQPAYAAEWNAQTHTAQVDLPNGRYYAELRSYSQAEMYGRVAFTVAGTPVTGLSATVLPLHPVPVEIRKDFTVSNDAAADQRSMLVGMYHHESSPGMNLSLIPADGPSGQVGSLVAAKGPSDGIQFQLQGVTPGRYWVRTNAFDGYVASITSGGVDLAREALVIGPGNTTPPIELALRNDAAQIHCTVQQPGESSTNGTASQPVSIFAVPISATTGAPLQGSIVTGSETSIRNVAPGTYTVIELNQFVDIDQLEPAMLHAYLSKGQTVTVEAGATGNVALDVIDVSNAGAESEPAQ